jgi:hypothetical protein
MQFTAATASMSALLQNDIVSGPPAATVASFACISVVATAYVSCVDGSHYVRDPNAHSAVQVK